MSTSLFVSLSYRKEPGQEHPAGAVHLHSGGRSREKLASCSSVLSALKTDSGAKVVALAIHKSGTVFQTLTEVRQRMVTVVINSFRL